jgi:hypothetical protein
MDMALTSSVAVVPSWDAEAFWAAFSLLRLEASYVRQAIFGEAVGRFRR